MENTTDIQATCALRATVNSDQPHRKAAAGPYASRRNTYWPPVEGNAAPSSAHANAPKNEITPASIHTLMINDIESKLRATRFGTRKMPPPIMIPTTIAIESPSESRRTSSTDEPGPRLPGGPIAMTSSGNRSIALFPSPARDWSIVQRCRRHTQLQPENTDAPNSGTEVSVCDRPPGFLVVRVRRAFARGRHAPRNPNHGSKRSVSF